METNRKRLIELALRGLELEKEKLDSEIGFSPPGSCGSVPRPKPKPSK